MTRREIINALNAVAGEDSARECEMLLTELWNVPPSLQILERDRDYSSARLTDALVRRQSGEPLAYILGRAYFCGEIYYLDKNCLIPRRETEILVEYLSKNAKRNGRVLDLCTGSGCIAISLFAAREDLEISAVDISPAAIEIAARNAAANKAADRITFSRGDVLSDKVYNGTYDAIVSNPPYIKKREIEFLSPEVKCEPRLALDGGEDGLDFYRAISRDAKSHLGENGFLLFEIGYDQGDELREIAKTHGYSCEIKKDYGNNDRMAILSRKKI